eukprot:m.307003 g.307003  ORF g.307003 m.307003 type:complete len:845 (-) comp19625_c2_seq22:125-2659(-)
MSAKRPSGKGTGDDAAGGASKRTRAPKSGTGPPSRQTSILQFASVTPRRTEASKPPRAIKPFRLCDQKPEQPPKAKPKQPDSETSRHFDKRHRPDDQHHREQAGPPKKKSRSPAPSASAAAAASSSGAGADTDADAFAGIAAGFGGASLTPSPESTADRNGAGPARSVRSVHKPVFTGPSPLLRSDSKPFVGVSFDPNDEPYNVVGPPVQLGPKHYVLCDTSTLNAQPSSPPKPFPTKWHDKWDDAHVKMPCSSESKMRVSRGNGSPKVEPRWTVIQDALSQDFSSSYDVEEAILTYNPGWARKWNFNALHSFCRKTVDQKYRDWLFGRTLPAMARLALRLPELCTAPIPLLRHGQTEALTLSQQQVACLLANAFFCTFPRRNRTGRNTEYEHFPDINFNRLFAGGSRSSSVQAAKLRCIFTYFERVTTKMPGGCVTFQRQPTDDFPDFAKSSCVLQPLHMHDDGTIEDNGLGMLQVDFANHRIGGGVLGHGAVQEEIRFLICPELIVTRLFTEQIHKNEAVVITGVEQFSAYEGYASSFSWAGSVTDKTPRDKWGRKLTQIVAIDAVHYTRRDEQYKRQAIAREVCKAYAGFRRPSYQPPKRKLCPVATGNWGCGAFRGDVQVKAILQLLACACAERELHYFTFGELGLREQLTAMHKELVELGATVGQLFTMLMKFEKVKACKEKTTLFEYLSYKLRLKGDYAPPVDPAVAAAEVEAKAKEEEELLATAPASLDDDEMLAAATAYEAEHPSQFEDAAEEEKMAKAIAASLEDLHGSPIAETPPPDIDSQATEVDSDELAEEGGRPGSPPGTPSSEPEGPSAARRRKGDDTKAKGDIWEAGTF